MWSFPFLHVLHYIASTEGGPPEGFPHRVQGSVRDWRVRPVLLSIPSLSFHSDYIVGVRDMVLQLFG